MSKFVLVALVVVLSTLCYGRHIHPNPINVADDSIDSDPEPEIDETIVENLRHIKQNHLVPINNILFFKSYGPCAEGLQRDFFGICREVWD